MQNFRRGQRKAADMTGFECHIPAKRMASDALFDICSSSGNAWPIEDFFFESLFLKNSCCHDNKDTAGKDFDEIPLSLSVPNPSSAPKPQPIQSITYSQLAPQWKKLVLKFYEDVKVGRLITTKKPNPLPDNFEEFFQCALKAKVGNNNQRTTPHCEQVLAASAAAFILIFGFNNTRKRLVPSTASKGSGHTLKPKRISGLNCVAAAFAISRRTMRRHLFRALGFPASGSSSAERVHFNETDFSTAKNRLLFFGTAAALAGSAATAPVLLQQQSRRPSVQRSNISSRPDNNHEQASTPTTFTKTTPTDVRSLANFISMGMFWEGPENENDDSEPMTPPSRQSSCLNKVRHSLGVGVGLHFR